MANNQLLASDNWAGGSLAVGWTALFGLSKCQVVAGSPNVTEPNALSTRAGQYFSGIAWPNDQISEFVVGSSTSEPGTNTELWVRNQSGSLSGYVGVIANGGGAIYRADSGTFTLLKSSTITWSIGDVFALSAVGACLSLYQNGERLCYINDATYTSGSVGFSQTSSVNITHTKVQSWAGYNLIQQDGIWQKQGVIIPANSTDGIFGTYQCTKILFEGNAQLLFGTVYKMWFAAQSSANIYYAESSDGKAWTRRSSAVISGQTNPALIKNGSTYHLYTQASFPGSINHYTSTDGISWTSQGQVLSAGTTGAWDASGFFLLAPITIQNGTWYGIYTGSSAAVTSQYKIGLATSPDGQTWAKYAGNPVLSGPGAIVGSQAAVQVNGIWYFWFYANQPGQGNASAPFQDPFDMVRYSTPDFINWSVSSRSMHKTQMNESLNANTGGVSPCAIIDVGSNAYLYYFSAPGDAIAPQIYQLSLAIGPVTAEQIITNSELAQPQIASDTFSGSGNLSSNWTTPTGATKLQITSGLVEPTATSVNCAMCYTGTAFTNDQYSEFTLNTLAGSTESASPIVRCATNAQTWYQATISGPTGSAFTTCVLDRVVSGSSTQLGLAQVQITPSANDVFRLRALGNLISLYQNGFLILEVQDISTSAITTGNPGILLKSTAAVANVQASIWNGGNAGVIPTYTTPTITTPGTATEVFLAEFLHDITTVVNNPPPTGNIVVPQSPLGTSVPNTGETETATNTYFEKSSNNPGNPLKGWNGVRTPTNTQ